MGDTIATIGGILLGLLIVAFFIAVIIAVPLALIWSLNTLGVATASYGVMEWLAAFLLTVLFFGDSGSNA